MISFFTYLFIAFICCIYGYWSEDLNSLSITMVICLLIGWFGTWINDLGLNKKIWKR